MDEDNLAMTLTRCVETGDTVEEEEATDDLLVRSHNTHSSSGRPTVNSPATHGTV